LEDSGLIHLHTTSPSCNALARFPNLSRFKEYFLVGFALGHWCKTERGRR